MTVGASGSAESRQLSPRPARLPLIPQENVEIQADFGADTDDVRSGNSLQKRITATIHIRPPNPSGTCR
jgi:hypothetical protein